MTIKEHLTILLEPFLEEGRIFVVDIVVKPSKANQKIGILVDTDEGITIQECTSISRRLAKQLEDQEVFTDAYILEVSSPGLDQPLILPRQYRKNIGRNLKLTLKTGEAIVGKLEEVEEEAIKIVLPAPKKKQKEPLDLLSLQRALDLDSIAKAMVEISFK
jgi:ribosome maturation factor RimP